MRKFTLAVHVTTSVGSIGAVAGFLVLAVVGVTSHNGQIVRAVYLAMDLITFFAIVPLILASLLTGIVSSLGTAWGLFRHYWVLVKLLLTILAAVVLLVQLPSIRRLADLAAETTWLSADVRLPQIQLVAHAAGGLLVLLVATALSVYKPRGVTRYGSQKQKEQRSESRV
jgi:hypothetical protein